jgi:hypothetical protein
VIPAIAIRSGYLSWLHQDFIQNPEVRRWLGGVEPVWTMLDFGSYNGLHNEPSGNNQAIRLEPNLTETDLAGSAVTRNARILLQRAVDAGGLKLTATGSLPRAMVAEMIEVVEWPGLDTTKLVRFHKVVNEPDFLPVHFVRVLFTGDEADPERPRQAGGRAAACTKPVLRDFAQIKS